MEWTASKPTPSSPAHLLWDWADAAAPGSSGEAAGRRGKEKRAKVVVGEEGSGGGGGGGNARCQVEGCGVELRAAKEYHRKHRVCEAHTKSPRVVVAGQERRFCQQCSRWVFPDVPSLFAGVVFVHSVWLLAGAALFSSFRLLSIQRFSSSHLSAIAFARLCLCLSFLEFPKRRASTSSYLFFKFTRFLKPGCIALCYNCVLNRLINPCKLLSFVYLKILVL
jgi:hypothetical protein